MRMITFAKRCTKEILRDPINLGFGLGFPLVVLMLLSAIQANIPVSLFEINTLTPGITVFGLSFMTLFSATLIAKDRESALLQRLYTTPLTGHDFIIGYMLPLLPIALCQTGICFLFAIPLGLTISVNIIYAIIGIIPMIVFVVDLCRIPLAETVGADPFQIQIITHDFQLLLDGSLGDRKDQVVPANAISQAVVLDILLNQERNSEYSALPCLLFHHFQSEAVSVPHHITKSQLQNITDTQAQVAFQHKGCCDTLIGATAGEPFPHGLDDFFVLLCGQSLGFLVHSCSLQWVKFVFVKPFCSLFGRKGWRALETLAFSVRIC